MSVELQEVVINLVLDAMDCRLMMESLKEDSLMEEETQSFRGVGDRNHKQGNFSAKVILMSTVQWKIIGRLKLFCNATLVYERVHVLTMLRIQKRIKKALTHHLPVFVVYDSIDERIIDGGGFCNNCRDSLGVW